VSEDKGVPEGAACRITITSKGVRVECDTLEAARRFIEAASGEGLKVTVTFPVGESATTGAAGNKPEGKPDQGRT
jgi:hypothetical protein